MRLPIILLAAITAGCGDNPIVSQKQGPGMIAASETHQLGERLYKALATGDGATLSTLLHPDFQGTLTAGLPHQFGRTYQGREAMIAGWGKVGEKFEMAPRLQRMFVDGDTIVGLGTYEGRAIATGKPVAARFAHFWTVQDGTIRSVEQVTDSNAWSTALQP